MKVLTTLVVLVLVLPTAFSQEPFEPAGEEPDIDNLDREYDPTPEMQDPIKVLEEILEKMKTIEEMLSRASMGEAYDGSVEVVDELERLLDEDEGGNPAEQALQTQKAVIKKIDELLGPTGKKQEEVIKDLDDLIRMIEELQQQMGGGGGCQSQQQKIQQSDQQKEKDKRKKPDKNPQDGRHQHRPGAPADRPYDPSVDVEEGSPPPVLPLEVLEERWGLLPPHIRDEIRQAYQTEFPEEYKQLIEEYYRKLNER